jgi:tRNA U34 5-methylaminomethyl-2-thiouridine-forming methyltransferase MnmC
VDEPSDWKRVRTGDGSWTLEHPVHGETCHSRSGAWLEARERYCVPCRLADLARERGAVRLLDVGTGLGLNLAAALEVTRAAGAELEIVTLERSPEVIRTAIRLGLEEPSREDVDGEESAELHRLVLRTLASALASPGRDVPLGEGEERGRLRLVLGDARETLPALEPELEFDAVFLDPFSHRKEPELWQPGFLFAVAARLADRGWLSTYSAATRVRAGLSAAGLSVGLGPPVGKKAAGTVARRGAPLPPFDPRIERRITRARDDLQKAVSSAGNAPERP